MATKPTIADATWATNANIASGPQSGSTTKLDPGLSYRQAGAVPGRTAPGRYLNFWFNQIYLWCVYLGDLHNSSGFLSQSYTWVTGSHIFSTITKFVDNVFSSGGYVMTTLDFLYCNAAGSPTVKVHTTCASLGSAGPTAAWVANTGVLLSLTASSSISIPLNGLLRSGSSITKVRVAYLNSGTAGVAPSFVLRSRTISGSTATAATLASAGSGGSGAQAGTTSNAAQIMSTGVILTGDLSLATEAWSVDITGSDLTGDIVYWVEISYNDRGPRNY